MFKDKRTPMAGRMMVMILLLLALTMAPGTALAAYNAFLKIDGIAGESQEKTPSPGEIDIITWSWGETSQAPTMGGAGAGKVNMQTFKFTMRVNKASPQLFQACAEGKHLKSAVLTVRKSGPTPIDFLKISFEGVTILSYYDVGNSKSAEAYPLDEVSFSFERIRFEYIVQGPDGKASGSPVIGTWDVRQNKP